MSTGNGDYYPTVVAYAADALFLEPTPVGNHKGRVAYLFRTLGGHGPLGGQKGLLRYGRQTREATLASAFGPLSLFILDGELDPEPAPEEPERPPVSPVPPVTETGAETASDKTAAGKPFAAKTAPLASPFAKTPTKVQPAPAPKEPAPTAKSAPKPVPKPLLAHFLPHPESPQPNRFPNPFTLYAQSRSDLGPGPTGETSEAPIATAGGTKKSDRKKIHQPNVLLPGGDLFLDPAKGWLMALSEALPGSDDPWPGDQWPALAGPELPPPGVSFVWVKAERLPETVADLAQALAKDGEGQTLVLSGLDGPLEALADRLGEGALAITPKPSTLKALDAISLESRLDAIKQGRKNEAEKIRADFLIHQKSEKLVSERLECWTRLQGLTRSLSHLRNEAHQRKSEWTAREIDLIDSQRDYDKAEKGQGGLMGLLGRKSRGDRLERSKAMLDEAERSMRRVRLEMESLLSEARTVEAQLTAARDRVKSLPDRESLSDELEALKSVGQSLISQAAALELPVSDSQMETGLLAAAQVTLSRIGGLLPFQSVDNLLIAAPTVTDPESREALTAFARLAKKRLVIAADFTSWSWTGSPPTDPQTGHPAWRSFMAAATLPGPPSQPASFLGPLPKLAKIPVSPASPGPVSHGLGGVSPRDQAEGFPEALRPEPAKYDFLIKMGFESGLAKLPLNHPAGPSLRAFGDIGPFCPVSALASIRLAIEASRKAKSAGEAANVYVMCGSRAQAALARSLLLDFGAPAGIMAGVPQDFELWPRAPLVILDSALAPPQVSNALTSPEMGRPSILRALNLADGALVVCGAPASMDELPPKSHLAKLWSGLTDVAWPGWLPLQPAPFWEALDQAKNEAFMILPPFEKDWWLPLANHFMSALRRKVKLTIVSELPQEGSRDYPGQVIRELRLFGANVVLSEGFSDLLTLIDGKHFSLGAPGGQAGRKRWPFLVSLELPETVPLLMNLFQSDTIQTKLGPGGPHGCPLCGWPYLLVNQGRQRDFDYRQGLRLGCLNPSCANHKRPRRLDERWPFTNPPVCPVDKMTPYSLKPAGRTQNWVCPKHGPDCPTFRHVPGDCPNYRP
ncbi:MAG: hypothetical protein LBJ61_06875 [Deltaproteobacteria bacterium]|nr:hypothetical protein [Deltaproteobacteria bacterium]